MTPLYFAWAAILRAQAEIDPTAHLATSDNWAVLDSQRSTLELWIEEEEDEKPV